jgi:hypothetical protein
MLYYATDICNKEALKNQGCNFVSNILIFASRLISFAAAPHGLSFPASYKMRNVVTSAAGSG